MADADGEVKEGDILIHSELVLPSADVPGVGQRTRRIATVHVAGGTTVRERAVTETRPATSRVTARLRYDDDSGAHTFDVTRDLVSIGRGGLSHRVDVRIGDGEALVFTMRELNQQSGLTILLIEHVMRAVMALAAEVVVVSYGEKIAQGTPQEIARHQDVLDVYLGEQEVV